MTIASTITIPVLTHPNFLHTMLHGLVRNSYYKHRIIIVWSDPERIRAAMGNWAESERSHAEEGALRNAAVDFETTADGHMIQRFASVKHYLEHHATWLKEHSIESVEMTDASIEFRRRYVRGEIVPGKTNWEGGVDAAHKDNIGLAMTQTEWAIPDWNCDFYPGWHWDKPIFDYALNSSRMKEHLIPMFSQPLAMTPDQVTHFDAWRDSPALCCHRMTTATSRLTIENPCPYVTRDEWFAFERRWAKPGEIIREPCGVRQKLCWVPWIMRTSEIRALGNLSYIGGGYDLVFDGLEAQAGFERVGFADSFLLHKGWTPIEPEDCTVS